MENNKKEWMVPEIVPISEHMAVSAVPGLGSDGFASSNANPTSPS